LEFINRVTSRKPNILEMVYSTAYRIVRLFIHYGQRIQGTQEPRKLLLKYYRPKFAEKNK